MSGNSRYRENCQQRTNFEPKATNRECIENQPGKWWKQWQTWQLFIGCLLGVAVGVGHHFYYSYLDGQQAQNQSWTIRSGTAIAFLAKLLFSISIGVAFPQRVWLTLRAKPLSIGAIDALFALRAEASSFFKSEMIVHAKLATMIAMAFWSLALVPILVPGSISVKNTIFVQPIAGVPIQNLNFSRPLSDMQYNGTTPFFTLPLANTVGIGAIPEQYNNPSSPAKSFISNTLYGKRIIDAPSPCGANCSFTQSFVGPAYKCDDVDYTRNETAGNPFCTKSSFGHGDCGGHFDPLTRSASVANWYMAQNSSGDACAGLTRDRMESCAGRAEPWWDGKLWVMYQYLLPEYRRTDSAGVNLTIVPEQAWERHLFKCQSYNTTYNLTRTYLNFQQTVSGSLIYLNPVNYTDVKTGSTGVRTDTYPAWVIHQTLYSLLNGSIMPNGRLVETDSTGLAMSALVQDYPFPLQPNNVYRSVMAQKPVQHLRKAIEDLHFNVTATTVNVETRNTENVWSYDWHVLVGAYGLAALLDIVAVVIGVRAMRENGGCSNLGFARTVATSRENSALDAVVDGWQDGMDPVPDRVKQSKITFGLGEGGSRRWARVQ